MQLDCNSKSEFYICRMKLAYFTLALLFILGSYTQLAAQHDHKTELGMSNAPVFFLKESGLAYGLHFHLIRSINSSRFGVGLGYERIFDAHEHHTVGFVGSYFCTERLRLNLAPGVTFEGGWDSEKFLSVHLEAEYGWEVGEFHIGPAAEIAYDPEDIHLSLGLHVGFGF
jgi:hypothetical protein